MALNLLPFLPGSLASNTPRLLQSVRRRNPSHAPQRQIHGCLEEARHPVNKRRSTDYLRGVWDLIESTTSPYSEQHFRFRLEVLKRQVSQLIKAPQDLPEKLRLIDSVDRLGVSYHFEKEIAAAICQILADEAGDDLFNTALRFRILRQYGHNVSPDIFEKFKDKEGNFKESITKDTRGLLSLYEASYLGVDGEDILDEARDFTRSKLKELKGSLHTSEGDEIEHALELPLRWRLSRLEARAYIKVYGKEDQMNPDLLEFSKLDFNVVQSVYQSELRDISRWWRKMGFQEKLKFSGDRCIELYIWTLGMSCEPRFSKNRIVTAKVTSIVTLLDDVYGIYGSIDELELFTQAVERWNNNTTEYLPYYMKLAYVAMFTLANGLVYDVITDFGANIITIIKKEWEDACKAYLVKARWFKKGYTPTLKEYLSNGCTSIGASTILIHSCILLAHTLGMRSTDFLQKVSKLIYWSSMVVQLTNDLANFKVAQERQHMSTSIQCYMKDSGKSEEDAHEHIMNLVMESWKGLNKEQLLATLPQQFIHVVCDFTRVSHFFCHNGNGLDYSARDTRDAIMSLFFKPV